MTPLEEYFERIRQAYGIELVGTVELGDARNEAVTGKAVEGNWKTKRTAMTPREYWERLKRSFNDKYVKEVEKRQGKENNHDAEPVD